MLGKYHAEIVKAVPAGSRRLVALVALVLMTITPAVIALAAGTASAPVLTKILTRLL